MIQRVKKSVTHQGIGGKEFKVDELVTKTLTPNEVSEKGIREGNPACWNFMDRREDFDLNFPHQLYYVKIDGIGYIIAEDEIDLELEPKDIDNGGAAYCKADVAITQELVKGIQDGIAASFGISNKDLEKSINESLSKGFLSNCVGKGGRYGA